MKEVIKLAKEDKVLIVLILIAVVLSVLVYVVIF